MSKEKKKLGFMYRVNFSISECMIVQTILEKTKDDLRDIDYTSFIEKDRKRRHLDTFFDETTDMIYDFWTILR